MFRRFGLALALLSLNPIAAAELHATTRIETYEVSGETVRAAFEDIAHTVTAARPFAGRYAGVTQSDLSWQATWAMRSDGECHLIRWDVYVSSTITMPHWVNADDAPARERRKWTSYYEGLEAHEQLHAQFAEEAALLLDEKMGALGGHPNCDALQASIEHLYDVISFKLTTTNLEYDRISRHGTRQGRYMALLNARTASP